MKKIYILLLSIVLAAPSYGQNFYRLSAGVSAGATYTFTDVDKGNFGYAYQGSLDYYFTPFVTAGIDAQMGVAKGGNVLTDTHSREFTNSYKAFTFNVKIRSGEMTDFYYSPFLSAIQGLYVGAGVGYVQNNMTNIARTKGTYVFPGEDKSSGLMLPVNLGLDINFPNYYGEVRFIVNINYQSNFVFNDNFDGYNDPIELFRNRAPDMFSVLSVGLKYTF